LPYIIFTFDTPEYSSYIYNINACLSLSRACPRSRIASRDCIIFLNTGNLLYTGNTFEVPERQSRFLYIYCRYSFCVSPPLHRATTVSQPSSLYDNIYLRHLYKYIIYIRSTPPKRHSRSQPYTRSAIFTTTVYK
jgi:hypothetical protein